MKNFIKSWSKIVKKSIFNFSHTPKKLKIEFEITKNRIELFEIIKNWKLNWKLPKNQFSIFSVIRNIKNWIESCPKSIFIFFETIENWAKMKWTFSYTDGFIINKCWFYIKNFDLIKKKWLADLGFHIFA